MANKELECPDCGALVSVEGVEKYEMVECSNCKTESEYIGEELINPEGD